MELGIRSIEFSDDEFIGGRSQRAISRMHELAKELVKLQEKHKTEICFRFFTRPDIIYRKNDIESNLKMFNTLKLLKKAGATRIFLGIEGGDSYSMKYYNRGTNLDICLKAVETCKKIGFALDIGFIMFYPHQTVNGILEMSRFFRKNNLLEYNTWPFRPLEINKGTFLESQLKKNNLNLPVTDSDINFMRVPWKFQYKKTEQIYNIIKQLSGPSKQLMYSLKLITKKDWKPDQDKEITFANRIVKENAQIFLDLLETLSIESLNRKLDQNSSNIIANAHNRINKLVNDCQEAIKQNLLVDRNNELSLAINSYHELIKQSNF